MAPTTTKTATPKAASTAGVKKAGPAKATGKKTGARTAMVKMQAYCKFQPPKRVFDALFNVVLSACFPLEIRGANFQSQSRRIAQSTPSWTSRSRFCITVNFVLDRSLTR